MTMDGAPAAATDAADDDDDDDDAGWRQTAVALAAASWFKKLVGGGDFPTNSCKFPTRRYMGAQKIKFNIAPINSPKRGIFSLKYLTFLEGERKFSDKLKFGVGGNCPLPRRHVGRRACCTSWRLQPARSQSFVRLRRVIDGILWPIEQQRRRRRQL